MTSVRSIRVEMDSEIGRIQAEMKELERRMAADVKRIRKEGVRFAKDFWEGE